MSGLVHLLGEKLMSESGEISTAEALASKCAVALYFSAHWCPPCKGFTPKLAEWYTKSLKSKGLEIVFVSSDKDEAAFKEYFGSSCFLGQRCPTRTETAKRSSRKSTRFRASPRL